MHDDSYEPGEQELFDFVVRRNIFVLSSLAVKQLDARHAVAFTKQVRHLRNLFRAHREWFQNTHVERINMLKLRFRGELPQCPRVSTEETEGTIEYVLKLWYPPYYRIHEFLSSGYPWAREQLLTLYYKNCANSCSDDDGIETEIQWMHNEYSDWACNLPQYGTRDD